MTNIDPSAELPSPTASPKKRRGVAVGLAGGLLAGTAAGLVFGVPGLTTAAPASVDVASFVQQADDETTAAAVERGDRLRATLQDLVDDGTITAEQADAVVARLLEELPERGGHMGPAGRRGHRGHDGHGDMMFGRGAGVIGEALTDLLGVDLQDLRTQIRDGATLAEIATANGIDVQAVVDELLGELEEHLDNAVDDGRIDQATADEKLADATERITDLVNEGFPTRPPRPVDDAPDASDAPDAPDAPVTTED